MAFTTVGRTAYNALVDDSGGGSDGSVWDKNDVKDLLDAIDAIFSGGGLSCNGSLFERGRADAVGDWIVFSPVLTGITIGNGTVGCKYTRIGKTVLMEGVITFGSTTSIGGSGNITLPVANTGVASSQPIGHAIYVDVSSGNRYGGPVLVGTTTVVGFWTYSAPLGQTTTTVPFTWATGDVIMFQLAWQEP